MRALRVLAVLLALVLLASITYFAESIASTDHHAAYCKRLTNAASLYLANPYAPKSVYKYDREYLQIVVNEGGSGVSVYSVKFVYDKALTVQNGLLSVVAWNDWAASVTAVYLEANSC